MPDPCLQNYVILSRKTKFHSFFTSNSKFNHFSPRTRCLIIFHLKFDDLINSPKIQLSIIFHLEIRCTIIFHLKLRQSFFTLNSFFNNFNLKLHVQLFSPSNSMFNHFSPQNRLSIIFNPKFDVHPFLTIEP